MALSEGELAGRMKEGEPFVLGSEACVVELAGGRLRLEPGWA